MRRVIQQSVVLPAPAESLFEMYLDATTHAAVTGFPVEISAEPGAPFHAFNKQISGQNLAAVRPYLIVQSWRSVKFHDADPDSTLILTFMSEPNDAQHGRVDLVHLDVPEHDYQDVIKGWQTHYWNPWRTYLENQKKELLG
jgi:hypothetical protein